MEFGPGCGRINPCKEKSLSDEDGMDDTWEGLGEGEWDDACGDACEGEWECVWEGLGEGEWDDAWEGAWERSR